MKERKYLLFRSIVSSKYEKRKYHQFREIVSRKDEKKEISFV